jgi:hypothetical protein
MASRSASAGNKYVTVRRKLSPDEQRDISSLFVKPGKIGGFSRHRTRSEVWSHFGELFYTDISGNKVSVDGERHYCSLCLKIQQVPTASGGLGHLSKVQSYTSMTATSTLCDHLRCVHDIKLSKVRFGYS